MKPGLPIAAYLIGLSAAAMTAAFVAALTIVLVLPPRPPGLLRGDQLIAAFSEAYAEAIAGRRPAARGRLEFKITHQPPQPTQNPMAAQFADDVADSLQTSPAAIRVAGAFVRSGAVVFRRNGDEASLADTLDDAIRVVELASRPIAASQGSAQIDQATIAPMDSKRRAEILRLLPQIWREDGANAATPQDFARVVLVETFEIAAHLPDGQWLVMRQGRNWAELDWMGRAALALGSALLVIAGMAALLARKIASTVRAFAVAVQAIGVDPKGPPILIDGPREIREAARAVNAMQDRLRVLIADRTQTLATVAHDMRTPLMRLRLAAENSPPDQRDRFAKHLAEVETLVASFIAFARDDPAAEKRVRLDLAALLDSLVADHQAMGRVVHYDGPPRLIISGQSLGLKRLFGNLIDNAVKHGGVCEVRLGLTAEGVRIDVLDDGPGVPETDRERIFEPFVRLAEGGAGLGLAAARSIARGHGGDIVEVGRAGRGAHFQINIPAI